jgi:hypothetical protein
MIQPSRINIKSTATTIATSAISKQGGSRGIFMPGLRWDDGRVGGPGLFITAALILLLLSACASVSTPAPGPPQPALYDLSIVVTTHDVRLAGVTVTVDSLATLTTNENGWVATQVPPGDHVVKASKDGYTAVEQHWTITRHTRKVIGLNPQ